MTKELLTVSMLAAAFALGAAEYISPNTIGRCDITKASTLTKVIVPVPFLNYNADTTSTEQIKVADLIQVGTLSAGDKLYKIANGKYLCWQLDTDKTEWVPVVATGVGGASGSEPGAATEAILDRGDGFWLETEATSVVLLGQAPATEGVEVDLAAGWNLVGVTKSAGVELSTITGAEGDKIIFSNGSKVEYDKNAKSWAVRGGGTVPTTLEAGTGFWYYSGDAKKITL